MAKRKLKKQNCAFCAKEITTRNDLGINIKLLGESTKSYHCLDCLAEYFECTVQDIIDKIEEFKSDGCELFS